MVSFEHSLRAKIRCGRVRQGDEFWSRPPEPEFHHLEVHFHSLLEQRAIAEEYRPPLAAELGCHYSRTRHRPACTV